MSEIFIGRQPIFDREVNVVAYELLYRDSMENRANITDFDQASSEMIFNALMEFGLDRLVGPHRAFINLTEGVLVGKQVESLPPDKVVLEVLESVGATAEVVAALESLIESGFSIALDDFVYQESLRPLVDRAEVIKVDVLGLEDAEIARQFGQLQAFPVKYLAEKVETQEQFEFCRDLGFDYFQGHFLSHPKVIQGRRITTNRMPVLRLLAELNSPDARVDKLETLIGQDISLSYRLLRYINSAFFNLTREVDSINHALVLLGLKDVRRWATLISLAESSDKPHELMVTAMVRAKMCELLAEELGESNPDGFFTVGLFSVLDALMDAPMEEMLEALPLSEDISQALLAHEGKFGKVLSCTLAYEDGNWKDVSILDMEPGKVRAAYLEAITWVDQADLALQESS